MAVYHRCDIRKNDVCKQAWVEACAAVIGASVAVKNERGDKEFWEVIDVSYPGISLELLINNPTQLQFVR